MNGEGGITGQETPPPTYYPTSAILPAASDEITRHRRAAIDEGNGWAVYAWLPMTQSAIPQIDGGR